jgi:hypothetical protein
MACTFNVTDNGTVVVAEDKINLFQQAYNKTGDRQQAIDIVATSLDENFIEAPTLNNVLDFVARENKSQQSLSAQQTTDLKNSLISLNISSIEQFQDSLHKAFYKGNIFNPTQSSLINSGLYTPYEVRNILNDVALQEQIKNAVERLNNTEIEVPQYDNYNPQTLVKTSTLNSFGKLSVINPFLVEQTIVNTLGDPLSRNEFDDKLAELEYPVENVEQTYSEMQRYSRIEQYPSTPIPDTFSALTLAVKDDVSPDVISAIQTLLNVSDNVAEQNESDVNALLTAVENGLIAVGIDVVGLQGSNVDKPFLRTLQAYLLNPSVANTHSLVSEYNRFFQINSTPKERVLKLDKSKNYVYSEINKPEDLFLTEDNLIKAGNKLFIKVRRIPVEQLKQITGIENADYLSAQIENIENTELAEEIALLKTYFGVPMSVIDEIEIANAELFEGRQQYLENDFVAYFQIAALKEKQRNSQQWNNFYSNFEINSRGMNLKNTDPITLDTVNTWIEEINPTIANNLKQYSLISKQLPILGNQEIEETEMRTIAVNNPMAIQKLNKESFRVDDENVVVRGADADFIRIGNRAYEATETKNGLTLYTQLPNPQSDYIQYKNNKPNTSIDLQNYVYLQYQPEQFVKLKTALPSIVEQNFDCI